MAIVRACILLVFIGMAVMPTALGDRCDACPQCIIFSPICATYYTKFATNNRRGFLSECHMHCYNKCHGTKYFKLYSGSKCI
ncbi:locustin-like [Zootermopsis nevadensis]|uniref:locustin-like n=1 Tax=Zootermopsis nevadensis TaxID=136037 RepID=UPI000B8EA538|nr:locustin-like [Zootermopsis nevadensis]